MKSIRKTKQIIKPLMILSGLAIISLNLLSCGNLFNGNQLGGNLSDKALLNISIKTESSGRTIYPTAVTGSDFASFELTGLLADETEPQVLLSTTLFNKVDSNTIEVVPGNWTFTLNAKYVPVDGSTAIVYSDTVEAEVIKGNTTAVSFNLKPQGEYGGFKISLDLSSEIGVDSVKATLKKLSGDLVDTQTFDLTNKTGDDRKIEYAKTDFEQEEGRLSQGTYTLMFEFFTGNDPTPINQWESYICIRPFFISQANVTLTFNSVYEITYNTDGGTLVNGIQIDKFSTRSSFDLPVYSKTNKIFLGWKDSADNVVTKINPGTTGNISLTAYFVDPVLYVSDWYAYRDFTAQVEEQTAFTTSGGILGDNTNLGFVSTAPLKTIDAACEKIIEYGRSDLDWKINITGKITGTPTYYNIGRTEIPETITSEYAKSITIEGARGINNGEPQDIIDRGITTNTTSNTTQGTALLVATSVPVTIKNLKITGGSNKTGTSEIYSSKGGGIHVANGATVILGDGVAVQGNVAEQGGGIYNNGTLYLYGSAIVGDKAKTTYASGASADKNDNNADDFGGGIYNNGKLYLGYSNLNTEADCTGGVYHNRASYGGGIYNPSTGEIVMRLGTVAYNSAAYGSGNGAGGGITNYGTLKISGGSVENNKAEGKGGAGVHNADNTSKGTGTFIFSGGTIKGNKAPHTYGSVYPKGGGVLNEGIMYVYGDAVIGDASATGYATSEAISSNSSIGFGGGLYVAGTKARAYLGYKSYTSPTNNEPEDWDGGIYYNYSGYKEGTSCGGGGLGINDSGRVYMHSGTIDKNGTIRPDAEATPPITNNGRGGAVFVGGYFYLNNVITIPAEANSKHDIFVDNYSDTRILMLDGPLASPIAAPITPTYYAPSGTNYSKVLGLAEGATTTIADECNKFNITPQINDDLGTTTEWRINSVTGKFETVLAQSQTNDNQITIDIGVNTNDLKMSITGTSGAYTLSGTEYTLQDKTKKFEISLNNPNSYKNYAWYLDDDPVAISTSSSIIFGGTGYDLTTWSKGVYDLCFECTDVSNISIKYTYAIQIKIE